MKPMRGGGYERLAFKGNQLVETKNMKTGATHTEAEFKKDRMKSHLPPGQTYSGTGDLGEARAKEAKAAGATFKGTQAMCAGKYFTGGA